MSVGQGVDNLNPDDLDEIDGLFFAHEESPSKARRDPGDTPVVALVCAKGGTGKTSLAVQLAGVLQTRRRQVGILDLDPDKGVERWAEAGPGFPFAVFTFDPGKGERAFREVVHGARSAVDFLMVDTPSRLGPATRMALMVADLALVPAGASSLDLAAIEEAVEVADAVRRERDGRRPKLKVVPSRQDARTRLAREFGTRLKALNVPKTPSVGQRIEFATAADAGRLVRRSSAAAREIQRLSRHVLSCLRSLNG